MKSLKMFVTLVATLFVITSATTAALGQARLPVPIIAPPVIQELVPYLGQYQNLRIGNASNPYEWVGQYHNAAMDYVGKAVSSPASAARIIGPFPGPTYPCWPYPDVIFRVNGSLFTPYAPDAAEAVDQRRNLFNEGSANARVRRTVEEVKLTDREQKEFNEFKFQLQGAVMALGSGRLSYDDFQRRVVELEQVVVGQNGATENVRMRILLMTTVARHSAYWNIEAAKPAARKKCPTCVESDIAGAEAGAAVGGVWGAVIGAVAASALDYFVSSSN